jgi:enamine deaminase RidA (YjgF/YER057c/UK114 family)
MHRASTSAILHEKRKQGRRKSMKIEAKLEDLGLTLPQQLKTPPGVYLPFSWVRVHGNRAYISGHGPQNPDGSLTGPFGKVGAEVPSEQAYQAARLTALSTLASLKRALRPGSSKGMAEGLWNG